MFGCPVRRLERTSVTRGHVLSTGIILGVGVIGTACCSSEHSGSGPSASARLPGQGRWLVAGILLGTGGFNLYDATIEQRVLQLHPVREEVEDSLAYDLAFIGASLVFLIAGLLLARRAGSAR
jgi:Predicted membrane protein (DUF2243)